MIRSNIKELRRGNLKCSNQLYWQLSYWSIVLNKCYHRSCKSVAITKNFTTFLFFQHIGGLGSISMASSCHSLLGNDHTQTPKWKFNYVLDCPQTNSKSYLATVFPTPVKLFWILARFLNCMQEGTKGNKEISIQNPLSAL